MASARSFICIGKFSRAIHVPVLISENILYILSSFNAVFSACAQLLAKLSENYSSIVCEHLLCIILKELLVECCSIVRKLFLCECVKFQQKRFCGYNLVSTYKTLSSTNLKAISM